MNILFDQGTPVPLRKALSDHSVSTAYEMGWSDLGNGALLAVAERAFDLLLTTDKNLRYQQNLSGKNIRVLVLPTTSWPIIQQHIKEVAHVVATMRSGEYCEMRFHQTADGAG